MPMPMNQSKMKQGCLDGDYVNKWTLAIFSLMLIMAASITLAVVFPYQGSDPYLRTTIVDNDSETVVVVVPEDGETVVVDNGEIIIEEDNSNDVLMQKDISNSGEEVSQPSVNKEMSSSNQEDVNDAEQKMMEGLFGPITTTADTTNNDSYSSCQSKLQEADVNKDNIINSAEYINFLIDNPIISHPLTGTQFEDSAHFEDLPVEYQVIFTHLAVPRAAGGGDGEAAMVGIPIGTVDEMQKVCLYVSSRGSSAVGQFDWDKMPSSP